MGRKTLFSITGAGKSGAIFIIMKLEHFLTPYKNKLKMDQRPMCKTRTCKTLRSQERY